MDERLKCPKCSEAMRLRSARPSRYWPGHIVEKWECPECGWEEVRDEPRDD